VFLPLLFGLLRGVHGQYGYAGPLDNSLMAWYKLNDAVAATTAAVREECPAALRAKSRWCHNMY
jgi:hypothetical protein